MGIIKLSFFALKPTVRTKSSPLLSLIVNIEPMDCSMSLPSFCPITPPVLPDLADFGILISPDVTSTVTFLSDRFEALESAAFLKRNQVIETPNLTFEVALENVAAQKALFFHLEPIFGTQKQKYGNTKEAIDIMTRQKRPDD